MVWLDNETNGNLTNFSFVIGDWGTSGYMSDHFGGTPMYASPNAFRMSEVKDLFAFGRIAAELYLEEQGKS